MLTRMQKMSIVLAIPKPLRLAGEKPGVMPLQKLSNWDDTHSETMWFEAPQMATLILSKTIVWCSFNPDLFFLSFGTRRRPTRCEACKTNDRPADGSATAATSLFPPLGCWHGMKASWPGCSRLQTNSLLLMVPGVTRLFSTPLAIFTKESKLATTF